MTTSPAPRARLEPVATANGIGGQGIDGNADGDPLTHGIEALLGTNPTVTDSPPTFSESVSQSGGKHLVLEFDRAETLPTDLTVRVVAGDSPDNMTVVAEKIGNGPWTGTATITEGAPSGGKVHVTVEDPVTGQPARFMQVKVSVP